MKKIKPQAGILNLPNDNIVKTIVVATMLCLVCSIIVSSAAIVLKPKQVANKLLDKKSNILTVAGISGEGSIDELFQQIETRVVDMATGEYTSEVDAETFDQRGRSKFANVYLVNKDNAIDKIILPVKGYGLWSTMYGFIALESDAKTVSGITFYEHGETPGLGGEIENKKWQTSWQGKQLVNADGDIALKLIKGLVSEATPDAEYKIDGLAGATLTSNGVTNLVQFWMGENGFGPYLERVRKGLLSSSTASRS